MLRSLLQALLKDEVGRVPPKVLDFAPSSTSWSSTTISSTILADMTRSAFKWLTSAAVVASAAQTALAQCPDYTTYAQVINFYFRI
jgi:hypothetical protein